MSPADSHGRTIQVFLADGHPAGLMIASIFGWTGSLLVASQSNFDRLLARAEVDRTGVYFLHGQDPENPGGYRVYIGEADSVRSRLPQSALQRDFWETAVVFTTSDEALTKAHVRYLEARLIEMVRAASRVALDNSQMPSATDKRLPEADRANMESFLADLNVILPVINLDILKPRPMLPARISPTPQSSPEPEDTLFQLTNHGVQLARAIEKNGALFVLEGSICKRDTGSTNVYGKLKQELVESKVLIEDGNYYRFAQPYGFDSPSAAAAVVLDRNANGRREWRVEGSPDSLSYHEWQERRASQATPDESAADNCDPTSP